MIVDVGSLEVGRRFAFSSGIEHEVVRHGEMGTSVRRLARVAKQVHDSTTGKTIRFSSEAEPFIVSSASEVTPL